MHTYVGQEIGNYTVAELLGRGTFGSVYLAWHTLLKNRPVAIKLLHDLSLNDRQEQTRFLQEAQMLDLLKPHPFILPLYDAGISEGKPYLIMEYAPGGTLKDLLSRQISHVLSLDDALRIVTQIGQALQYAHEHAIIHRDVKPANMLFTANGDVLLADFGIALPLDAAKRTMQADAIGTPLYMAPEQFENRVSTQSDQYALACVLYEMVSGRPPFVAQTPLVLAYKHATEVAPLLRELNPSIPPLIEQAVRRALTKKREDRFPTLADFLLALQPVPSFSVRSTPVLQPQTQEGNVALFHEEVTAPVLTRGQADNVVVQGQVLFEQERYEEALECFWQAVQREPQNTLCVRLLGATLFLLSRFEEAHQQFEYALSLGEQSTQIYHMIGVTQHNLQQYEGALRAYEQALALDPNQVQLYLLKGSALEALARENEALITYFQALQLDPHLVEGYKKAGDVLTRNERYEEALPLYLAAYENDSSRGDMTLSFLLGNAYYNLRQYEEALLYYRCVAENEPHNATVFKNTGDVFFALERFIEALTAYEQVIRLLPDNALSYIDKGNMLYHLGYSQEALACYEQALHCDTNNAAAWYNVGLMQTCLGNGRQAQLAYKRARKLGFQMGDLPH